MGIKTFVFLDLETTGLPSLDGNTTKITEMCLIAVESDHFQYPQFRIQNKLNLCFHPEKQLGERIVQLTGLSDAILCNQGTFKAKVNVMVHFLNTLTKPICFVAHNGLKFDYPILKAELHDAGITLSTDILCIDSIDEFRAFEGSTSQSYGLEEVYKRLIGKLPSNAHEAEADTIMMMECASKLGKQFVNWANTYAGMFSNVSMIIRNK